MDDAVASSHSVVIDIPKPRTFGKRYSVCTKSSGKYKPKKPSVKRPSDNCLTKYSVLDKDAISRDVLKKECTLLAYRGYLKLQNAQQQKTKLAIKLLDKYKIEYTDLRRRLQVEDPPFEIIGCTDVDEDFFTFVEGRPLPHCHAPLFKSLHTQYDNHIRTRLEVGFRNDAVLNIDANQKIEQEKYKLATERCKRKMKYFDEFISDDYNKSMALLAKWENLKFKVEMQKAELSHLAGEKFLIESKLVSLDYTYRRLQRYGRFFYYLSPPSWRAQNRDFAQSVEIEARGFEYGSSKDDDTFTVMFEKMQKEYLAHIVKPPLYFQKPADLMKVFEIIEMQHQNHFDHVTHMAPHAKILNSSINTLRALIAHETAATATAVDDFKRFINFYAERGDQLEAKFFKILHGIFYECVGIPDVLKLKTHLEFCYEKVFGEPALNMEISTLARELEACYMKYTKLLDELHSDKVRKAVKQYEEYEKMKFKRSKEASRELRLFERLRHELMIAFLPPPDRSQAAPQPKWSSLKRRIRKKKISVVSTKPLTQAEEDYQRFFTDWCSDEDPADYLQSSQC